MQNKFKLIGLCLLFLLIYCVSSYVAADEINNNAPVIMRRHYEKAQREVPQNGPLYNLRVLLVNRIQHLLDISDKIRETLLRANRAVSEAEEAQNSAEVSVKNAKTAKIYFNMTEDKVKETSDVAVKTEKQLNISKEAFMKVKEIYKKVHNENMMAITTLDQLLKTKKKSLRNESEEIKFEELKNKTNKYTAYAFNGKEYLKEAQDRTEEALNAAEEATKEAKKAQKIVDEFLRATREAKRKNKLIRRRS